MFLQYRKARILLLSLVLVALVAVVPALAAYQVDVAPTASENIEAINDAEEIIRAVSFTGREGWVILWEDDEVMWNGVPDELEEAILELYEEGEEIKQISFTADGGWVLLFGGNGARWDGIPQEVEDTILELNEENEEIKWIAFTEDDGYAIFYGRNAAIWNGIPEDAEQAILDINEENDPLNRIAFVDDDGWVIIYNDGESVIGDNLPADLVGYIEGALDEGSPVSDIAFTLRGGYSMIIGGNGYAFDAIP
jgi:photosystem II stability/assembly factor-like uncharacterized protein